MKERMVYIHIPFCIRKCFYCDFVSYCVKPGDDIVKKYVDALCGEIGIYADKDVRVDSVYIGGGTPSFLYAGAVERLMRKLEGAFDCDVCAERSIEVNPGVIDEDRLKEYADCGMNRVSMGAQSFNDDELRAVGRIHNERDAYASYEIIRKRFDNVSVDIMTGLPKQTLASFEKTLAKTAAPKPEHISCYALTPAENTRLYDDITSGRVRLPEESLSADMSDMAAEYLSSNGYYQYEVSNYALPGYECAHNVGYWEQREYYGFGASACGHIVDGQTKRYGNISGLDGYIEAVSRGKPPIESCEALDAYTAMIEHIMLGLRMSRGVSRERFRVIFGKDIYDIYGGEIQALIDDKLLIADETGIRLTKRGMDTHNACVLRFM